MSNQRKYTEQYRGYEIIVEKLNNEHATGKCMLISNQKKVVCFIKPHEEFEPFIPQCKDRIDQYIKVQQQVLS